MIDVCTFKISKADFQTLPKEERAVVLVSGHIINQIGVLLKLVNLAFSRDPTNTVESNASGMQTQILLRFLIAVLSEACTYFEERGNLIDKYLPDMHQEGKDAYKMVKAAGFNKKGFLRLLRNNYLYHYPNDKNLERAFKYAPETEDEPWEWYLASANTNSLYFSSELVMGRALMRETGEPTDLGAFAVVMDKAKELANAVPDFLMRLIETIFKRHLRGDVLKPSARTIINDAPKFGEFWLPFFVEEPAKE